VVGCGAGNFGIGHTANWVKLLTMMNMAVKVRAVKRGKTVREGVMCILMILNRAAVCHLAVVV
jgi:hypothetical protein